MSRKNEKKDALLKAAERVLKTFGAAQDYERQSDRWDDEDHAALDALRKVVEVRRRKK